MDLKRRPYVFCAVHAGDLLHEESQPKCLLVGTTFQISRGTEQESDQPDRDWIDYPERAIDAGSLCHGCAQLSLQSLRRHHYLPYSSLFLSVWPFPYSDWNLASAKTAAKDGSHRATGARNLLSCLEL